MQLALSSFMFLLSCSKDTELTPKPPPVIPPPVVTANPFSAVSIIDSMGTGFNLGNTFDNGLQSTNPSSIYPIIDLYYNAGMKHIRIPVSWMDAFNGNNLADANGNVNFEHPRFVQLKSVIDYAISKKMYVVLNAHHENWLYNNYNGSKLYDDIFSNLWTKIAIYFKDYPHLLVFEILNEPQGIFGDWSGGVTVTSSYGIGLTRQINKVGYDAIRLTGGLNLNRIIMVSSNGKGNHSLLINVYPTLASLPGGGADKYLAFHVHAYDPWTFCGETGTNANWPGGTTIANSLIAVSKHAKSLNVPVNYGEFGVGRVAGSTSERNSNVVREYYRTMRLTCLSEKMSPTVWDDRGWFGLVNASGSSFLYDIVPSMMAK